VPIKRLRDTKYDASAIKVFETVRFIVGPSGAACTGRIKRALLQQIERPGDVLVLGFTADEQDRMERWIDSWPDRQIVAPLIDRGLTKDDCKAMIERAGIRLPAMYLLGYDNANCIGCVKGGHGYFRAIREDFPEQFERLAQVEDAIGANILRHRSGPLKGQHFGLRDLPEGKATRGEALPNCGLFCEMAEKAYAS
jgi:hypothetical protein